MSNERLTRLRNKANTLAEKPGVYLMKNSGGDILYVGKAKRLKRRVVSYFRKNKGHDNKVRKMVEQVADFDYVICDTEVEALILECNLIKQHAPKYNILLKDDKGYHYIRLKGEPYPKIRAVLQKQNDKATYLGPYTSFYAIRELVDEVNKIFQLPTCSRKFPQDFKKERPCLNFHIKTCDGLCLGRISPQEYAQRITGAMQYLKQGSVESLNTMQQQMEGAAQALDFETAAKLRDKIRQITKLREKQKVLLSQNKQQDFVGVALSLQTACIVVLKFRGGMLQDKCDFLFFDVYDKEELLQTFLGQYYLRDIEIPKIISIEQSFESVEVLEESLSKQAGKTIQVTVPQRGEQQKLVQMAQSNALEHLAQHLGKKSKQVTALQQLGELLGLDQEPHYIESYDISNIASDYMVGGMVVFYEAKPLKSAYKRFHMKENLTQDDYACMCEMIKRRFMRYLDRDNNDEGFARLPDLILLDGGKGHVSVVVTLLEQMGIEVPVFGMVKDNKHKTSAIAKRGEVISLSGLQSAFSLVSQIQEEVHRFAIAFQRQKHKKSTFQLQLTTIAGIGEKRALMLLKAFPTRQLLQDASVEELSQQGKVSQTIAQKVYDFLHQ